MFDEPRKMDLSPDTVGTTDVTLEWQAAFVEGGGRERASFSRYIRELSGPLKICIPIDELGSNPQQRMRELKGFLEGGEDRVAQVVVDPDVASGLRTDSRIDYNSVASCVELVPGDA